jgi:hypothetical protein
MFELKIIKYTFIAHTRTNENTTKHYKLVQSYTIIQTIIQTHTVVIDYKLSNYYP